jgi:hypothetical protein
MYIDTYHLISYSPVVILPLNISTNEFPKYINEAYRLGDSQNHQTNVKAIMSTYTVWSETKVFNPLLDTIGNTVFEYLTKKSYLQNVKNFKLDLRNAWSAIYKKGHYTLSHNHGLMDWSFVYYLQSTGTTPLIFDDSGKKFYPKTNTLIIFPGHMNHSVPKHKDEEDRICLAGNFLIIY